MRGNREHSARLRAERKASWSRITAGEGFIYVAEIVGSGKIKIGFSLNPQRRILDCAGFHAYGKRRLLAMVKGSLKEEQALHRALKEHQRVPDGFRQSEVYPRSILSHPAIPLKLRICDASRDWLFVASEAA